MNDTIAAISTGLSESGIGVIRISGPDSYEVAGYVLRRADGAKPDFSVTHRVQHAFVLARAAAGIRPSAPAGEGRADAPATPIVSHETLDEVLVINMKGPHTYTGEDTVEIDCHGGVLMMKRVLGTVIAAGARLAEPGEFTKRAFLSGRMDLAEAEAVADLIAARSDRALRAAMAGLKGETSRTVNALRKEILTDTAYIEAALDDPEHYELTDYGETLRGHIESWLGETDSLIASFERGRLIREGINTAIIGKPNTGKSSLLNALLGEERAIVTDVPGTTRDTVNECLVYGDTVLNITDTAGIRDSLDPVESVGITRARESIETADLVLFVMDGSTPPDERDRAVAGLFKSTRAAVITILNKSDLEHITSEAEAEALSGCGPGGVLSLSALRGDGIEELLDRIAALFSDGTLGTDSETPITRLRHAECLRAAKEALGRVIFSIDGGLPEDFYTIDLMEAYRALGQIVGEEVGDDLIDEIFSSFCMGK